jgi:putative Mn2+ efflux pump MntP
MELITTVLLALGLAADAFAVSISSGLAIRHININKALKIALFFGSFQAFMPVIGWLAGLSLRDLMLAVDHWVAFGLLSLIGAKMIYESFQDQSDEKKFNPLDTYTLLMLSLATSIDALAVGVGFALLKTSILAAITTIGLITFFLSFIGVFIGHKFGDLCKSKIELLGGLTLIIIGSKILIEHLTGVQTVLVH